MSSPLTANDLGFALFAFASAFAVATYEDERANEVLERLADELGGALKRGQSDGAEGPALDALTMTEHLLRATEARQ